MAASKQQTPKHGSGHQHPAELRERAVRMVQETMKETGERHRCAPFRSGGLNTLNSAE